MTILTLDPAWLPTTAFVVLSTLLVVLAIWVTPRPIGTDCQQLTRRLQEGRPTVVPTPGAEGNPR
ncbi:hypothetical protein [Nocardioides bigeumensis]|uniref:hypothetical protein n=1 Tax=Nocardioides bigeumensis TaxID=433657 RepID=UPI0031D3DE6F